MNERLFRGGRGLLLAWTIVACSKGDLGKPSPTGVAPPATAIADASPAAPSASVSGASAPAAPPAPPASVMRSTTVTLAGRASFDLQLPAGLAITPAFE